MYAFCRPPILAKEIPTLFHKDVNFHFQEKKIKLAT